MMGCVAFGAIMLVPDAVPNTLPLKRAAVILAVGIRFANGLERAELIGPVKDQRVGKRIAPTLEKSFQLMTRRERGDRGAGVHDEKDLIGGSHQMPVYAHKLEGVLVRRR
jgi:hypothetical protein